MKTALLSLVLATPLAAQEVCPPVADHEAEKDAILAEMRFARTPGDAQMIQARLWAIYFDAPDARALSLLQEGQRAREGYDFAGAREIFDDLVDYCPEYAEGYNQRAFASYLQQDYEAARVDLERVMDLDPRHVPALAGLALTLMGLDLDDEAQLRLREALRLNPWLNERALLEGEMDTDL